MIYGVKKYAPNNSVLIYATGRQFERYELAMKQWPLVTPDVLISQDGAQIHWYNKGLAANTISGSKKSKKSDENSGSSRSSSRLASGSNGNNEPFFDVFWNERMKFGWNQQLAESLFHDYNGKFKETVFELDDGRLNIEPFRVSLSVLTETDAKAALTFLDEKICEYNRYILKTPNLSNSNQKKKQEMFQYHSFYCIDPTKKFFWVAITPCFAGKGNALNWILNKLKMVGKKDEIDRNAIENEKSAIQTSKLIVCGDSGNDVSMMNHENSNVVIVANSSNELIEYYQEQKETRGSNIYLTNEHLTLGVIEGLEHFSKDLVV